MVPWIRVVAVELRLDVTAIQGSARRDRRHEPFHRARRQNRGIPRIRQWRGCDGAARRRAGADGKGVPALDRLAQGAAGDEGLSGAAERLARQNSITESNRESVVTYQHILYEVSDKIATVTLNRPDRMNAWTATMERDVRHAMETAAADDSVRVIVLTGAGRAFCAGADMEALQAIDPKEIRRGENTPFDMNR